MDFRRIRDRNQWFNVKAIIKRGFLFQDERMYENTDIPSGIWYLATKVRN